MIDTDSYRRQTAFRINQAVASYLTDGAKRHVADIAIANVETLCDEVDRLRATLRPIYESAKASGGEGLTYITPEQYAALRDLLESK